MHTQPRNNKNKKTIKILLSRHPIHCALRIFSGFFFTPSWHGGWIWHFLIQNGAQIWGVAFFEPVICQSRNWARISSGEVASAGCTCISVRSTRCLDNTQYAHNETRKNNIYKKSLHSMHTKVLLLLGITICITTRKYGQKECDFSGRKLQIRNFQVRASSHS